MRVHKFVYDSVSAPIRRDLNWNTNSDVQTMAMSGADFCGNEETPSRKQSVISHRYLSPEE